MAAKRRPSRKAPPPSFWERHVKLYGMAAAVLVPIFAVLTYLANWWIGAGLPTPVWDRELKQFRVETLEQIGKTETKVIAHSDKNTSTVSGQVTEVVKQLGLLQRDAKRFQVENLEKEERNMRWVTRERLVEQLANIQRNIEQNSADAWLPQRKAAVQKQLEDLDTQINDTRARIKQLKDQL